MNYKKTHPEISYQDFLNLVKPVDAFESVTGKAYQPIKIVGDVMSFVRKATGEIWKMDLKGVHKAYLELTDFKTANFKPYVRRTHSPALGLLLEMGLLKR